MQQLVKTQQETSTWSDDDPQISYMISAWARICQILGDEFHQYLPTVMGPLLKAASFKPQGTSSNLYVLKLVYPTDIDLLNNDKFNWSIPTRKKKKKMMDRGNMLISVVDSLLESPQLDWKRSLLHARCLSVMPRHDLILLRVRSGADRHTLEPYTAIEIFHNHSKGTWRTI